MKYLVGINLARLTLVLLWIGWFISRFQLMGAVLITLAGMLLARLLGVIRIRTLLQSSFKEVLPWKNLAGIMLAAGAAAIPAFIVNTRLDLPTLVVLPICGTTYLVVYALSVWIFGLVDESEKAALKRALYIWKRAVGPSQPIAIFKKAS
jgi:hypothetical protein